MGILLTLPIPRRDRSPEDTLRLSSRCLHLAKQYASAGEAYEQLGNYTDALALALEARRWAHVAELLIDIAREATSGLEEPQPCA